METTSYNILVIIPLLNDYNPIIEISNWNITSKIIGFSSRNTKKNVLVWNGRRWVGIFCDQCQKPIETKNRYGVWHELIVLNNNDMKWSESVSINLYGTHEICVVIDNCYRWIIMIQII